MSSIGSSVAAVDFSSLATALEAESSLREKIRDAVRDFEAAVRSTTSVLSSIHATPEAEFPSLAGKARETLPAVQASIKALAGLIPQWSFYKYNEMWGRTMQSAAFAIVLIGWLESDRLITKEEVAATLAIDPAWHDHFQFNTEDYLHSLITAISELARLSPNSVTVAATARTPINVPLRVSRFVKDLSGGFALLNLKNDSLRRRFDSIKYDLKSIESVVYDLTLRGLVDTPAHGPPAKRQRSNEGEPPQRPWRGDGERGVETA